MLIVQVLERHAKLRQVEQHGRVFHGLSARTVGLDFGVEIAALVIVQLDAQTVYRSRQGDATRTRRGESIEAKYDVPLSKSERTCRWPHRGRTFETGK